MVIVWICRERSSVDTAGGSSALPVRKNYESSPYGPEVYYDRKKTNLLSDDWYKSERESATHMHISVLVFV